ncbi:MAG: DUF3108 domain-containing protein [Lentisphaerae bacterium]|nr:MAG: DUF3108 domain-containing protein [Lentisphaerota bacterium]
MYPRGAPIPCFVLMVLSGLVILSVPGQEKSPRAPESSFAGLSFPFMAGEQFHYRLKWKIFTAGKVEIAIRASEQRNRQKVWHFVLIASTTSWIDKIYKVRQIIHAFPVKSLRRTCEYEANIQQGKFHYAAKVEYEPTSRSFVYHDKLNDKTQRLVVADHCIDPLSVLYLIRSRPLPRAGEKYQLRVTDGLSVVDIPVIHEAEEKYTFAGKKYQVAKLRISFAGLNGLFDSGKRADVFIWFTRDTRKLPVMISGKVTVGRFYAYLERYVPGGDAP